MSDIESEILAEAKDQVDAILRSATDRVLARQKQRERAETAAQRVPALQEQVEGFLEATRSGKRVDLKELAKVTEELAEAVNNSRGR